MIGSSVPGWPCLVVILGLAATSAPGDDTAPGSTGPAPASESPQVGDPTLLPPPPAVSPSAAPVDRLGAIEARLRALEEQNRLLSEENQELRRLIGPPGGVMPTAPPRDGPPETATRSLSEVAGPSGVPGALPVRDSDALLGSPPDSPVPGLVEVSSEPSDSRIPILGSFDQGFQFRSEDGEFELEVHLESQTDYRAFFPSGQDIDGLSPLGLGLARDGIYQPRNRLIFGGSVTRRIEYLFSINRGFSDLNLLDSFVNLRDDDRLQLKVGRFQSPHNYEQFAIQNLWLIAPERSLFTSNLGLNRQVGAMLWGTVRDDRLDYALAVVSGPRNSYEDFNNDKDVMSYLNLRPFLEQPEGSLFRLLNVGGSFAYGLQENPLVPRSFRLATNASNAGTADRAAPPFMTFNPGVIERGQRSFWSAHMAYFYRSLSVLADYNGAILRYARDQSAPRSAVLPTHGMSVGVGYFLTGEEVERRALVEPLRPFNLRRGQFSLGAVELIGRYSTFDVDSEIFDAGLADRALWSNSAWVTNLGVNWYPNKFMKIILDWQHAEFGSPVLYALPDQRMLTNEMLWLRLQLYY